MTEHATSIDIDAPPDVVFDLLTTPEGMTAWMGQYAELDPRADGRFAVDVAGYAIRGRFLVVERPTRVVVTWGVSGSDDLPPGSSTVSFTLTPTERGTHVEVVHSDLPDARLPGHLDGWGHFLPRLRTVAPGGDAGPDTGRPRDR